LAAQGEESIRVSTAGRTSPFGTFEDVEPYEFVPGVHLRAVGGEQVLLCRVEYEAGKQVSRHAHEHTEQVMFILEGEVTMTIEDQTRTLRSGDTVVVNRGLEHELHSPSGVVFIEALAPVPLDHVPEPSRDLVLGPDGGATHVEH
jgi:quercetin dioxygenase-like cupin family protein